jgi:hypothetical protein
VSPRRAFHPVDLRAFLHRGVRCGHAAFRRRTARCSHGLWIDDDFRMLPRCRAAQTFPYWTFRLAVPTASASPTRKVEEGKESRPCLAPAAVLASSRRTWLAATVASNPKVGARRASRAPPKRGSSPVAFGSDVFSKEASRPHPTSGLSGMSVDPPRGESPPRRSAHPKAHEVDESRRPSEEGRRDPARAPKSRAGGSSSAVPSFRGCPRT